MKSGKHFSFKNLRTGPIFSDGTDNFTLFKKQNTVYLQSAKQRKITGSVRVTFFIETNGMVSEVKAEVPGLTESLNQEAVRVVSLSPLWVPGTIYGIPTRMQTYTVIYFYPY